MKILKHCFQNPVNRIRYAGTSAILTIDKVHVRRLKIDALTFFEEKPVENGILLEMRKLDTKEEHAIVQ